MNKNELSTKTTGYELPEYLEKLMAFYGITDENIDNFEKEMEEEYQLALEKWNKLYKEIMAGE